MEKQLHFSGVHLDRRHERARNPLPKTRRLQRDCLLNQHVGPQVAPNTPLMDAGLNSLTAVQLALQLEQQTGVALSPTLIFDYGSCDALDVSYCRADLALRSR